VLLGDRPPLTTPANFYQRILADDPEEALKQAETLLRDMTLVDYYDSVMLQGLQLAHSDMMRGVIPPDQLMRITEALLDIIAGLEDIDEPVKEAALTPAGQDVPFVRLAPAPALSTATNGAPEMAPQAGSPVLCIAGRGGLDELLAAATVQLLAREGIQADLADYAQFSRRRLAEVNLSAVTTICVVSLDAGQSSAYLRILLRRLHQRAPAATLTLGFMSDTPQQTQEHRGTVALAASSFRQLIALARPESSSDAVVQATTPTSDGMHHVSSTAESARLSPDSI
jgi:hypothetical protein